MLVTDLDGTLARNDGSISPASLANLEALGERGVVRVVATGRSPFVARRVLRADFPIDYLVVSTGAGIYYWPKQELLKFSRLDSLLVEEIQTALIRHSLSFFLHAPVPRNHHFHFYESEKVPKDFHSRRTRYQAYGAPLVAKVGEASQFLVVCEDEAEIEIFASLETQFPSCCIHRATSPIDGKSIWIEIFQKPVSKSEAAQWIAERHGVTAAESLAVGNDYNDIDLLAWAGQSFVVANAPKFLREKYQTVASNEEGGFSEVAERLLAMLPG